MDEDGADPACVLLCQAALCQAAPPVILVNGYQSMCATGASSADTFGLLQQKTDGRGDPNGVFDNCGVRAFLLQSSDESKSLGQAPWRRRPEPRRRGGGCRRPQYGPDSFCGRIWRQATQRRDSSAGDPGIRKAVFLATPHFGALAIAVC